MRRVVTRRTEVGSSRVVSDGSPPQVITLDDFPELQITDLWATDEIPVLPVDDTDPTLKASFLPEPGGTRFRIVRIAPTQRDEGSNEGLHSTDTLEYLIIVSGEIWLTLDDGSEVHLQAGEYVVQNGTRHALYNRGSEPCVMAAVLVGTQPKSA
ncbi:MAG: cupin domain-containing protein [Cyanobacteria bacterium]|jgi:quercetin dioxygenase-like cupin family protein|nr:cupin domain-containing protein [Cyanobacteria bacterium GSL.Bin21]